MTSTRFEIFSTGWKENRNERTPRSGNRLGTAAPVVAGRARGGDSCGSPCAFAEAERKHALPRLVRRSTPPRRSRRSDGVSRIRTKCRGGLHPAWPAKAGRYTHELSRGRNVSGDVRHHL